MPPGPLHVDITDAPLSVEAAFAHLQAPEAGGVSLFVGTTRRWTGERETLELAYECYRPMALAEMRRLLAAASSRWPVARGVLVHRVGVVPVAEASVIVGVATPHRADAFAASRFLIDELKRTVPIWKQERLADGRRVWVEGTRPSDP